MAGPRLFLNMTLPPNWSDGLTASQIAEVSECEQAGPEGRERISPHPKGYERVYLGRHHPYADKSGVATVHRWQKQRELGRRLEPYEHVHHDERSDHSGAGATSVMHAIEHGQYHYHRHFVRDARGRVVWVRCGQEMTEDELAKCDEEGEESEDTEWR